MNRVMNAYNVFSHLQNVARPFNYGVCTPEMYNYYNPYNMFYYVAPYFNPWYNMMTYYFQPRMEMQRSKGVYQGTGYNDWGNKEREEEGEDEVMYQYKTIPGADSDTVGEIEAGDGKSWKFYTNGANITLEKSDEGRYSEDIKGKRRHKGSLIVHKKEEVPEEFSLSQDYFKQAVAKEDSQDYTKQAAHEEESLLKDRNAEKGSLAESDLSSVIVHELQISDTSRHPATNLDFLCKEILTGFVDNETENEWNPEYRMTDIEALGRDLGKSMRYIAYEIEHINTLRNYLSLKLTPRQKCDLVARIAHEVNKLEVTGLTWGYVGKILVHNLNQCLKKYFKEKCKNDVCNSSLWLYEVLHQLV